jgi:hypothetical protein
MTRSNITITLGLFSKYLDPHQANMYAAIVAVCTIYLIIISYVVYYFKEDFEHVFCKKKIGCTKTKDD